MSVLSLHVGHGNIYQGIDYCCDILNVQSI